MIILSSKNRIENIDIAKGIGILLVYIGHTLPPGNKIWNFIFLFHMPLFFFISGYLINEKKYDIYSFFRNRIKTILLPCVTYGSLAIVVEIITNNEYSLCSIRGSLPHVFWFLPVLFFSELLLILLWKIFKLILFRWCVFIILLLVGMFLLPLQWPYDLSIVPLCTSYCALGNLLRSHMSSGKCKRNILFYICFVVPLIAYTFCSNNTNNLDHHIIADGYIGYFLSIVGICFILHLSKTIEEKKNKIFSLIKYCGQNSLEIYALHITLIKLLVYLFLPIKDIFGPKELHLCYILENIINVFLIWAFIECRNKIRLLKAHNIRCHHQ